MKRLPTSAMLACAAFVLISSSCGKKEESPQPRASQVSPSSRTIDSDVEKVREESKPPQGAAQVVPPSETTESTSTAPAQQKEAKAQDAGEVTPSSSSEETDWKNAKSKNTVDALDQYLKKYPSGKHLTEATHNLEGLKYGKIPESHLSPYPVGRLTMKWGVEGKLKNAKDDDLPTLTWEEISKEAIQLYQSEEKSDVGDIYWVGGDIYCSPSEDVNVNRILNEENIKNNTRYLEVCPLGEKKKLTLLRVIKEDDKYRIHIVSQWIK